MYRILIIPATILLTLCLITPLIWAIEFTPNGIKVTVSYTEPTNNADGSSLKDLVRTNVYCQIPGNAPVKGPDIRATSPTGGGQVSTTVFVPLKPGQVADVQLWVTASTKSGGESERSTKVIRFFDRRGVGPL